LIAFDAVVMAPDQRRQREAQSGPAQKPPKRGG
jgi:hypothetical protein